MYYFSKMALVIGAVMATSAFASTAHDHGETRHTDAHVHGAGHLNFAVEGKEVHVELEIPGFDILGFESVTTDAQHQQLDDALLALQKGTLWRFPAAANCSLKTASAGSVGESDHDDHDSHHDNHHDSHHGSHYDNHHDDDHDSDHGHKTGHMGFEATYVYECANPEKLNSIGTTLFDRFENSATLDVQGFTDAGQTSVTLSREKPEASF